jgi:hypothetical protein
MKRLVKIKLIALTLVVLIGAMAVSATERPFSLSGKGIANIVADPNGNVSAEVIGSGNATHLGLFTSVAQISFVPDPNDPNLVHPTGQAIFTAADGDKVNVVVGESTMDLRTGIGTGTFLFTGGTGRFANATGSISVVVEQNFITGAYQLTAVGKLDY